MTLIPIYTTRAKALYDADQQHGLSNLDLVPVRICKSLGRYLKPRWPEARNFPAVEVLVPLRPAEWGHSREKFEELYRGRLDETGFEAIEAELAGIHQEYDRPLALFCHEDITKDFCHRQTFGAWWEDQTGDQVPELDLEALKAGEVRPAD
jgi:hypothetical protein